MVVPQPIRELLVVFNAVYVFADSLLPSEIECPIVLHGNQRARWSRVRINLHKFIGFDLQTVIQNVSLASVEIEVRVVGEVEHSRLVSLGLVVDSQRIAI